MKNTTSFVLEDGAAYDIPNNEVGEFVKETPGARRAQDFRVAGQIYSIPEDELYEFVKDTPEAEPVRRFRLDDGTVRNFTDGELSAFLRSDEYRKSADGIAAQKRQEAVQKAMGEQDGERPGFWGELRRNMLSADGIREVAEDSIAAKPYAYANDLANSAIGGLLRGGAKIEKGAGRLWEKFGEGIGNRAIAEAGRSWQADAEGGEAFVDRNLPTDMLDTSGDGVVDKSLQVGKNVMAVTGEFAPSMVPVVGNAYAAALIGAGADERFDSVYKTAKENGASDGKALLLASTGAVLDAGQNMLLMGKFKGVWKGGQANAANAAKDGLMRRLMGNPALNATKETAKVGGIMSGGGMGGDVIDQIAEDGYWHDMARTANVGMDQFVEGGMFHLVNSGLHSAMRIGWGSEPKGIPAGAARDMLEAPEGRALVISNSPDAACAILRARQRGEDVSRKMIEDLGVSRNTAPTVADRNALGDRITADYLAFKERVRTRMDDLQAKSLADEIASRMEDGANDPMFEKTWLKSVEQIKDAHELDDPYRRAEIVDEALKHNENKGEKLHRLKAVKAYNETRAEEARVAEDARRAEVAAEHRERSMRGMEERRQRKADMDEYERQEAERKAREAAEEANAPTVAEEQAAEAALQAASRRKIEEEASAANAANDPRNSPEYKAWLDERGRADNDKNWNRYVAENELDPSLRVDRGRNGGKVTSEAAEPPKTEAARPAEAQSETAQAPRQGTVEPAKTAEAAITIDNLPPLLKTASVGLAENGGNASDFGHRLKTATKEELLSEQKKIVDALNNPDPQTFERFLDKMNRHGCRYVELVEFRNEWRRLHPEVDLNSTPLALERTRRALELDVESAKEQLSAHPNSKPLKAKLQEAERKLSEFISEHKGKDIETGAETTEPPKPDTTAEPPKPDTVVEVQKQKANGEPLGNGIAANQNEAREVAGNRPAEPSSDAAYRAWLAKYKLTDSPKRRKEWEKKHAKAISVKTQKAAGTVPVDASATAGANRGAPIAPNAAAPVKPPKAVKPVEAAKPQPVEAAKQAAPDAAQTGGNAAPKRTIVDAQKDLEAVRDDESLKPKKREARVKEIEDEIESLREPDAPYASYSGKPNAKKAAKIFGGFVATDKTRASLMKPYHDKKSGVVVATDGGALIATKHGFDPNAEDVPEYPRWKEVIPDEKSLVNSTTVNPAELAKACKNAIRLAKATGNKKNVLVALRMGDKIATVDAKYMLKVAEAMDANGITELRTGTEVGKTPIVAKNADTTIAFMPIRVDGGAVDHSVGRNAQNIAISAHSGRLISAPERTDTLKFSRKGLDISRKDLDAYKRRMIESVRDSSPLYAEIRLAQKDGVTDPETVYGSEAWGKLTPENRAMFAEWLKTTDADRLAEAMADYEMGRYDNDPGSRKSREAEIARIEKRIAAEDEIEGLLMRRGDAETYLHGKPNKPAPAQPHENVPVSVPKEMEATTPPKAAKPSEGRKSGDAAVVKGNSTTETPAKRAAEAARPAPTSAEAAPMALDGYLAGKKPIEAYRIKKVLGKKVAYGGGLGTMTEGEFVERALQDGNATLSAAASLSKGGKPAVSYSLGGHTLTKTAADYARAIGAKVDENSIARANEYLSLHQAVKAREAQLKAKGFRGGEIESFSSDAAIEKLLASRRFANPSMLTPADKALVKELNAVKEARIKRGDWNPGTTPGRKAAAPEEAAPRMGVDEAKGLLKEKFFQGEAALRRDMAALPPQAERLRGAYETAIAEAKRRSEAIPARRAVESVAKALASDDAVAGSAAMEDLRTAISRGEGFPDANAVKEVAKSLPEDKRKAFTANMDMWREYAERVRETPSVADEATRLADEVDAAIAAEERGGAKGRPEGMPKPEARTDGWTEERGGASEPPPQVADAVRKATETGKAQVVDVDGKKVVAAGKTATKNVKTRRVKEKLINAIVNGHLNKPIQNKQTGEEISFSKKFASEFTRSKSTVYLDITNKPALRAKFALVPHLRDIVENMTLIEKDVAPAHKHKHPSHFKSFDNYETMFSVQGADGKVETYTGRVVIARHENGTARFYDIVDIKKLAAMAEKLAYEKPQPTPASAAIISQTGTAAQGGAENLTGMPDTAPRGRGTGTLPHDEPKPQGTQTTGRMRGIVTPQSFLKEARSLFPDVAIRGKGTARMKSWAAGHFEPAYRAIRARDMKAIGTITHELGHELETLTRYDLPRDAAAKRDLSDLGHALYGPNGPKPNSYIGEGFAEYLRGYICNAPDLSKVAPDMHRWFTTDFKAKHPDIIRKVDRLRDMVQTMKEQSAADTVRGFRRPATSVVERVWKKVTGFFSSENWNDAASTILKGMRKSGIDKLYHWQDEFRELEAAVKAGDAARARSLAASVSDKIANHPYLFPTITRGTASQRVMDMARNGTTNLLGNRVTGESLKDIFADFSHREQEAWKDYAIARHGLENYYAKGLEFGLPKDTLEAVVKLYDSPKFRQALQRVTDYSHRILHLGVDSGLISQNTYDEIVARHPIYIRITRRKAEDMAGTKQGGAAISRRTGGFENILDPIDAMLMDQEKFLRACFQAHSLQLIVGAANRAKNANLASIQANGGPNTSTVDPKDQSHIAVAAYWPIEVPNAQEKVTFGAGKLKQGLSDAAKDYARRTGEDPIPIQEFIDDLATYTDPQGRVAQLSIFRDKPSQGRHNLVSVYIDGKLHTYELPDMKWANMLTDVYGKSDFNWVERTFGLATAGIRLGATTINPGFAIRNGIRDSFHAAVMSESGALPMLGTLNGMLNQLTGKEAAQMFRMMGGHMSDLVGVTKEQKWHHGGQVAMAQTPLQAMQAYGAADWALMKPVIKAVSDVLSVPELGPRIREFNGILQKCRAAGLDEDVCAMLAMSHAKDISIDFQRAGRYMRQINHFIPFFNAMWRGSEQTVRNLGATPALPHQFEDRDVRRGAKTVGKGLAFITSWTATLALMEMSGDEEERRAAFERSPVEKWEYVHIGDWRSPLPYESGYIFSALPKAAIYEMNGDKGAVKECLKSFAQAMPTKYLSPDTAVGSISLLTPWVGLMRNKDYRGRDIVPEHIMENRVKTDWHTPYTTELSKIMGKATGQSPAQLEYVLDGYTGGLYRRVALAAENIGDVSRLSEGRGLSILDTLRARPQANRLIGDFYEFDREAKQKLGSGALSLEEYGKYAAGGDVKKRLTERFGEVRAIRADKSIPLAEQDRRIQSIMDDANAQVRAFNAREDYRAAGIAKAAESLTEDSIDDGKRERLLRLLDGVTRDEVVSAMRRYGNEVVKRRQDGREVPKLRWSADTQRRRIGRMMLLMQGR